MGHRQSDAVQGRAGPRPDVGPDADDAGRRYGRAGALFMGTATRGAAGSDRRPDALCARSHDRGTFFSGDAGRRAGRVFAAVSLLLVELLADVIAGVDDGIGDRARDGALHEVFVGSAAAGWRGVVARGEFGFREAGAGEEER